MEVNYDIPTELIQKIDSEQAWGYRIIPIEKSTTHFRLLTDSAFSNGSKRELSILFGLIIDTKTIPASDLDQLLSRYYRRKRSSRNANSFSIDDPNFFKALVNEAIEIKASDIHIEPYEHRSRIRMRIDGKLIERYQIKKEEHPGLVNQIKIKSNLDIAEKRLPQDGRIPFEYGQSNNAFDIRVSVSPSLFGEKLVMRLLARDTSNLDIQRLGLDKQALKAYLSAIQKPNGMILISGPTGSGKTTTLYATMKVLNTEERNIQTIEDPIEYTLEGINQAALNEQIGYSFPRALRSFLRQDPDIIMVGEIRDPETANMAIRASLTGHLVLSTIHTNSAWGIVARLLDMDIPPYLLADTLNIAVAQRLVRLLCPNCKKSTHLSEEEKTAFPKLSQVTEVYEAVGCNHCYHTGYQGRKGIYEVIIIDKDFVELIKRKEGQINDIKKEKNIQSLSDSAIELLIQGETSLSEVVGFLESE